MDGSGNAYVKPSCEVLFTDIAGHAHAYVDPGNSSFADLSRNHDDLDYEHPNCQVDNEVSENFQLIRNSHGQSIPVTCAYRCPTKNNECSSEATSQHDQGNAFDYDTGTSAGNWNVAVKAAGVVGSDRVLLYKQGGGAYMSYAQLTAGNYNGTVLPPEWTEYTFGHVG